MPYADGESGHYISTGPEQYLEQPQGPAYAEQPVPSSAVLGSDSHRGQTTLEAADEQLQQQQEAAQLLDTGLCAGAVVSGQSVSLHAGGYGEEQQRISFQDLASG